MFDGILFDLDGTLWDSTRAIAHCWAIVLARHPEISRPPITVPEVCACMGLLLPDITRRLFPDLSGEVRDALTREQCAQEAEYLPEHGGVLYPGVESTLASLARETTLFVVSNCQDGYIQDFYRAHGLGKYFAGRLCAGTTGLPKSGNIAQIVREYGLRTPVYVGDTQLDLTSARAAGVPFLHAAYGFGTIDEAVPAVERFTDIPKALAAICPSQKA